MDNRHQLSNTLRITNVNDFLTPSNACVLPVGGGAIPAGSVLSPIVPSASTQSSQKNPPNGSAVANNEGRSTVATVTVSDCLACSGCVTSAETVLLSSANLDVVRAFASARRKPRPLTEVEHGPAADTDANIDVDADDEQESDDAARWDSSTIAVMSQQAVASLATRHNLPLSTAALRLSTFLRQHAHFDYVVDQSVATHVALHEAAAELVRRHRDGQRPTITSACPGWVTYAEKTQPAPVLAAMSAVRSPQAIAAALTRQLPAKTGGRRQVWVVAIAQCHDKKLEAIRPDLVTEDGRPQVDCVITAAELHEMMDELSFDIATAVDTPLDDLAHPGATTGSFGLAVGSGSDGYARYILRAAAKQLFNIDTSGDALTFEKISKSGDVRVATLSSEDGSQKLRFATAYGFRSLQSILRKLRNGTCPYDYIELMACPGGCNNGGGQLPPPVPADSDSRTAKQLSTEHLNEVERMFYDASAMDDERVQDAVRMVYDEVLHGDVGSDTVKRQTRMKIESRMDSGGMASLDW